VRMGLRICKLRLGEMRSYDIDMVRSFPVVLGFDVCERVALPVVVWERFGPDETVYCWYWPDDCSAAVAASS
jgi:hypothetical protein